MLACYICLLPFHHLVLVSIVRLYVYVRLTFHCSGLSETAGGDPPGDMLHHRSAAFSAYCTDSSPLLLLSQVLDLFDFGSLTEMNDVVEEGVHRPVVYGIGTTLL